MAIGSEARMLTIELSGPLDSSISTGAAAAAHSLHDQEVGIIEMPL